MFNLDQAIADWRRQMAAVGLNSAAVLDELESHLRDEIEVQIRSGLEEERAFELACRRLGPPGKLSTEFARSGRPETAPRRIFLWCFYFFGALVALLADLWTLLSFELSPGGRIGAACGVGVFALYLFGLPFLSWWISGARRTHFLRMMKALGVMVPLWILFALATALRIVHWEIGIIPEMTMWSLCAAYGLTALAWALIQGGGAQGGFGGGGFLSLDPAPFPPGDDIPGARSASFSPTARRALEMAREEALTLGHDFIGTEHVLLGLLKAAEGALAQSLQRSHISSEAVRAEVARLISALPDRPSITALPFTPRARKALHFATREAGALEHSTIDLEHILLGLVREGTGVAAIALSNLGVRLERLRCEILRG